MDHKLFIPGIYLTNLHLKGIESMFVDMCILQAKRLSGKMLMAKNRYVG